jgi:hypothetical protein
MKTGKEVLTTQFQKALIFPASVCAAFWGFGWLYTFIFTNYRAHLRIIGIPLGIAAVVFSIGLLKHSIICVWILILTSIAGLLISMWILSINIHIFYIFVVAACVIYIGAYSRAIVIYYKRRHAQNAG